MKLKNLLLVNAKGLSESTGFQLALVCCQVGVKYEIYFSDRWDDTVECESYGLNGLGTNGATSDNLS
jgi:hypothetical protein